GAVVVVVAGLCAVVAEIIHVAGGSTLHRAFSVAFYVGGGVLFLFALTTHGAEKRAYGAGSEIALMRVFRVPGEGETTLNPTGALAVAGVAMLVLGVVFEATLLGHRSSS